MTLSITHPFVCAIADDPAAVSAGQITPSKWNQALAASGNANAVACINAAGNGFTDPSWLTVDLTNQTLNVAGGTVTTSQKAVNITQTWNASGVTFDAPLFMNITNTASAAGSLLADFQASGATAFGFYVNSINSASLGVYNTGGGTNNYERGVLDWTSTANQLTIGLQVGGTGTVRAVSMQRKSFHGFLLYTDDNAYYDVPAAASHVYYRFNGGHSYFDLNSASDTTAVIGMSANNVTPDSSIARVAAKVVSLGDGANNANGWLQWAGEARCTANTNSNNTTVLAIATGMTVTLLAGRTYSFIVEVPFTCTAAQGIRAAMVASGGLTATNIVYGGYIVDSAANGIKGNAQATALGTVVANAALTGTAGLVRIAGTITVNVAGSIQFQFAQSSAAANNTTVLQGAYMWFNDMP